MINFLVHQKKNELKFHQDLKPMFSFPFEKNYIFNSTIFSGF